MAGETRRQRRDARRASGEREPAVVEADASDDVASPLVRRGGRTSFARESWAELRKVDWPRRNQVVQGTVVVLVACAAVGAFLWGVDQVLRPFVRDILIG